MCTVYSIIYKGIVLAACLALSPGLWAQAGLDWPEIRPEMRPGTRWWWMGSAVDSANLAYNLEQYARAGMGTVEITPIYGVKGNEAHDVSYLSPQWMALYGVTVSEAKKEGMLVDMNNGTGWPFGGLGTSTSDAACKLLVSECHVEGGKRVEWPVEVADTKQSSHARLERLMAFSTGGKCLDLTSKVSRGKLVWDAPAGEWHLVAAFCGKTLQKVKRAAPGGEGYVIDHFSARAVKDYLLHFDKAFATSGVAFPHNFFNDSYEVYKADWTEGLFDEFYARRGYKLEEHLPEFLSDVRTDTVARIVSDYRETLSDLLLENFTRQWTAWAHAHGTQTRSQAHGSPGNLIDLYAAVDVPECEGFGLTDFGIKGLRKDSLTRPNFSDISMLKYASSAAHIAGKPYTSSETFTWLTEHFRTSLSQCKPDLDLMFLSGVNHVYFHGTTYSPKDDPWPGWKFYASVDMSPTNSIWKDAPAFFEYITRCQSLLQQGRPDNDFLLYLPLYDIWYEQDGRLLMFDIHKMDKRAPRFIEAVNKIRGAGYDVDYISDRFITQTACRDGLLLTPGGVSYKALVVPGARLMPVEVLQKLLGLAEQGATVVFLDSYPEDVPGWGQLEKRRKTFGGLLDRLKHLPEGRVIFGTDYESTLAQVGVPSERLYTDYGLSYLRRSHEDGFLYFISALTARDTDGWLPLSVDATSVVRYNPMDGTYGRIPVRRRDGQTEVYLQLASGESAFLKTFTAQDVQADVYPCYEERDEVVTLDGRWGFRFLASAPRVDDAPSTVTLGSWTDLPGDSVKATMGTACYSMRFRLPSAGADEWMLSLGDVRESARVRVNGHDVTTLWALPYRCLVGRYLKPGENVLEVEVTNLPANRIAEMDRKQVPWRKFKDINIATINYKKGNYAHWQPMESGLLGPVRLIPMRKITFN